MNNRQVRVRFAPSPTGFLHVGGARTALFNWLFARHQNGVFILRIEDTDQTRYREDVLRDLLESLRWLGLNWDEGPEVEGDYGPYFQSKRLHIYQEYVRKLLDQGCAYECYCTPERLTHIRKEQQKDGKPPGYDRHCRWLTNKQRVEYEGRGIRPVIRFKVPLESQTSFNDLLRGNITVENSTLDDLVLLKSDGYPTYHLANVIDDTLMKISHVMRAEEWIPSTPRHILIYKAFGWAPPYFAHLPVILAPEGGKLSKRNSATPVNEFRKQGYLPEAMINFLALIGWSPGESIEQEFFTESELIKHFDLSHVNRAPGAFSSEKLDWMNGVYIRKLSKDELLERLLPIWREARMVPDPCPDEMRLMLERIIPLIQERMKKLTDVVALTDFFFTDIETPPKEMLIEKNLTPSRSLELLKGFRNLFENIDDFSEASLEKYLRSFVEGTGLKTGETLGILRVALTGNKISPPLLGVISILGREKVLKRLGAAEKVLMAQRRNERQKTQV